jgi:hypothetical protein
LSEKNCEELWPLRPKPLPDELLTSWLIRLADAHAQKLRTFTSLAWPGRPIWNGDIDKSADEQIVATLAARTSSSQDVVWRTTLAAFEGVLFEARSANGKMRWVLPLGLHPRARSRRGVSFCFQCLQEDEVPYFRRTWRLAFATTCVAHGAPLTDRCPRCDAIVLFHRGDMGHKGKRIADPMSVCHTCRADFRDVRDPRCVAPPPGAEFVAAQGAAERVLSECWAEVPGHGPTPALLYFRGLRQIAGLLLKRGYGERLRAAACERYSIPSFVLSGAPQQREIEYFERADRQCVLELLFSFLGDWPDGFVETCTAARLWEHAATENMDAPPYWYWRVVHEHLERSDYIPSIEEIAWSIAKNDEVLGGLYLPPHQRIRFTKIWNSAGIDVSPWRRYKQRRAGRRLQRQPEEHGRT